MCLFFTDHIWKMIYFNSWVFSLMIREEGYKSSGSGENIGCIDFSVYPPSLWCKTEAHMVSCTTNLLEEGFQESVCVRKAMKLESLSFTIKFFGHKSSL